MTVVVEANEPNKETLMEQPVVETEATGEVDTPVVEVETPEKYRGKSLEEVIAMHQNAEEVFSKHSIEVSESRKTIENMQSLIDNLQTAPQNTEEPKEEVNFEDEFYNNPKEALNRAIENHPELIQARQERVSNAHKSQLNVLQDAYPDWQEIIANPDFKSYVQDSTARQDMLRMANDEFKPDMAIELFKGFETINMIDKTREANDKEALKRQDAMRQTTTESRSSGDSIGGKKTYSSAELIHLKNTDPATYESMREEIYSAYTEGRVT